jgi:BirA family biotin operon repressor/biotin-[acetyl-CoA-carboxylase] ligase
MTLVERPPDQRVVGVLALRLGLALADALQPMVDDPIALKWPNDVLLGGRKLSGILVEARWREAVVDWVAIGIGINLSVPPTMSEAASLRAGTTRRAVLEAVVPGLRRAAVGAPLLSPAECEAWNRRDWARGRDVDEPMRGRVVGIDADGALLVEPTVGVGAVQRVLSGSLRLRAVSGG